MRPVGFSVQRSSLPSVCLESPLGPPRASLPSLDPPWRLLLARCADAGEAPLSWELGMAGGVEEMTDKPDDSSMPASPCGCSATLLRSTGERDLGFALAAPATASSPEIGRASGRERVSSYV